MIIMRMPLDSELLKELGSETDRGAAIVGATIVEYSIGRALLAHMRTLSNGMRERLFDGRGPLATFAARIDVAFAFQIIGPKTREDLNRVRDVRNAFAHKPTAGLSFDAEEISKHCRPMCLIDRYGFIVVPGTKPGKELSQRDRFLGTVSLLASQLDGETVQKGMSSVLKE